MYITFDEGSAAARRAEVGRIIVRFDREREVVELVQQHRAFDGTNPQYGDIHRLAWSVVAQMAPDVVRGRPEDWLVPGSTVEHTRELTDASAVTEVEQRMTVETCVIDELSCWFHGDEAFCDPEVLAADFEHRAAFGGQSTHGDVGRASTCTHRPASRASRRPRTSAA